MDGPRSAAPVSLQISRMPSQVTCSASQQPLERGVGHVGEAVLEPEVVQLARAPDVEAEPAGPPDRVRVPGGPLAARQLGVGRRGGEVVGEPIVGAQHHDREVDAGLIGREVARPLVVLEVAARDPQHDAAVDDVGHVPGERREQLLVDRQRDVDAGRDAGERGRFFDERADLVDVVRDERERIGRDA